MIEIPAFGAAVLRILPPVLVDSAFALWAAIARVRARPKLRGVTRLHLGSGSKLLDGWANLDRAGPPGVVQLDLTGPLPVDDASIDLIFSEHFIEHLTLESAKRVASECFRVLRPGGRIRISTPDLESMSGLYLTGKTGDWRDVNWCPATPCQMMNELHREWGHRFIFDRAELSEVLLEAGFEHIRRCEWRKSDQLALCNLETRPDHEDLIVEAAKPL